MSTVRLGSFETIREVGSGGMGTVWEGRHLVTGSPVAVKFLTYERAREPRWLAAFQSEARAIARLSHPRVVRIHDIGVMPSGSTVEGLPAGSPFIVMEWVSQSLRDLPRPLAWETVRAILLEVLDALAHVHARDIVHRDIKPSNVLGKLGRLRIADFGIARVDAGTDDAISGVSGTPFFMAPEQFTSSAGRVGTWTDLYAVGCLAYLLSVGQPPFGGDSVVELATRHLHDPFPLADLDDGFAGWLRRLTAKNPAARYRFASEAARDLASLDRAFTEATSSVTERWISPGHTATDTLPLTTVLLDLGSATLAPTWTADSQEHPAMTHVPDWRTPAAIRAHVEHIPGAGLAVSAIRVPPFVGRERERDVLWSSLRENLLAGRSSAVQITGPPGIGKSRLGAWLAERAHELGLASHVGPVSCRTTDEPFVRLARDELGTAADDDELLGERVDQRLAGTDVSVTERNAITHFLTGKLAVSTARERLDAMRASLEVCAGGRPLIVLLDDVEDAGADVIEAVHHSVRASSTVHFVLTSERGVVDPRGRLTTIELGPLDDAYVDRIVRDLAGLHQDLAADIVAISRQNPGRAIRLVRGLVERGELRGGEHGFELQAQATLDAPESLALWRERLDHLIARLGPTVRAALEVAVVLGDEVLDDEWLAVASAAGVFVATSLAGELEQRGFAEPTSRGWAFTDPELSAVLAQSARDRNAWKTYVAAARQALPDASVERRASWALEAGLALSAAQGFMAAANAAETICQTSRSIRMLSRAEDALSGLESPEVARLRTEAELLKASLWGLERLDEADELASRAAATSRTHGWDDLLGRALERRAKFARKRVDLPLAERLYREARDAYQRCGDVAGTGGALQGLGMVAVSRGELREAEALYNDALGAFLPARALRGAAWCANGLGDVYRLLAEHELAQSWYERALNWFEVVGDSYGAMWCVHDLSLTKRAVGDLDGAVTGLTETIRMAKRLGQRVVAPRANLGIIHVQRGEEALARPIFEEILEESRIRGVAGEEGIAHACLMPCDAAVGRWDDVRSHLAAARAHLGTLVDADIGLMAATAADHAARRGETDVVSSLRAFAKAHGVG